MSIGSFLRAVVAQLTGVDPTAVALRRATGATMSGGVVTSATTTELSDTDALNAAVDAPSSTTCSGGGSAGTALNVTLSVTVPPMLLASLGGGGANTTLLEALAASIQDRALAALNAPSSSAHTNVSALVNGLAACTGVAPGLVAAPEAPPQVVIQVHVTFGLDSRAVAGALGALGLLLLLSFVAYKTCKLKGKAAARKAAKTAEKQLPEYPDKATPSPAGAAVEVREPLKPQGVGTSV